MNILQIKDYGLWFEEILDKVIYSIVFIKWLCGYCAWPQRSHGKQDGQVLSSFGANLTLTKSKVSNQKAWHLGGMKTAKQGDEVIDSGPEGCSRGSEIAFDEMMIELRPESPKGASQ